MTLSIVRKAQGNMKMGKGKPIWLETVTKLYPPVTFTLPDYVKTTRGAKIPKPPKIVFPEDRHRRRFFREHPTECFRMTSMDERLRKASPIRPQPDQIFAEQIQLMEEKELSAEQAYQIAREKYQKQLQREELNNRVAEEQVSRHTIMSPSEIIEKAVMEEKYILEEKLKEQEANHQSTINK